MSLPEAGAVVQSGLDAARAAYVEACSRFGRQELGRLKAEIEAREARLRALGEELRAVSRERAGSVRRLAAVEAVVSSEAARFEHEFDTLVALPGVRSVVVEDNRVRVVTDAVIIDHAGERYDIGDFALDLDIDRGVRITNLRNTSATTGWDHPHVQGTAPCLGNLQEGCELLLGQLELVPLVSLLLQFLETYDPTTAYGPVSLWRRLDR